MHLILASASPRRAELLRAAGYRFEVRPVDIDETVRRDETPEQYVVRLADEKAVAAARLAGPGAVTLGADTAVVVDQVILGKPLDDADAERMLRLLSGRVHEVLTGICVRQGGRAVSRVERTRVTFTTLRNADIQWHVKSGEGMDKAGGYAIQGLASRFIPRIDGSYSNVVGLPVATVTDALDELAGGLNGSAAAAGKP